MNFDKELLRLLEYYNNSSDIGKLRFEILDAIQKYYQTNGFPKILSRVRLSLVPSVFQEANYDNIWWGGQNEELGHLNSILELDCMFHNNGKGRRELTDAQFKEYINFSFSAIEAKKKY